MPYSYAVYTGNGATTQFTVPFPYIRREHVVVSLNYVSAVFTWVNNTTVQVSPAPANAVRVEVRRVTPVNNPLVDFTDGSTLVAADLDTNYLQQTYINQEQDDQFNDGVYTNVQGLPDAGGKRITNVGNPTAAQDVATKSYTDNWFNTYGESYLGAYAADPATKPNGGALVTGNVYFNTTTGRLRVYNGTAWSDGAAPTSLFRWKKTAVGGETSLSGNDDDTQALAYVADYEQVYINGALMTRGVDYLAINGTTITGLAALTAGDVVEVLSFNAFTIGTVPTEVNFTAMPAANQPIGNSDLFLVRQGTTNKKVTASIFRTELATDAVAAQAAAEAAQLAAETAETGAEAARDAAFINADVYASTAAGLAATSLSDQFQVVVGDQVVRYRHDAGPVATEVAQYPAADFVFDRLQEVVVGGNPEAGGSTGNNDLYRFQPNSLKTYDQVLTRVEIANGATVAKSKIVVAFVEPSGDLTTVSITPFPLINGVTDENVSIFVPTGCVVGIGETGIVNFDLTTYTTWFYDIPLAPVGQTRPKTVATNASLRHRYTFLRVDNKGIAGKASSAYANRDTLESSVGAQEFIGWPSPVNSGSFPGSYTVIPYTRIKNDGIVSKMTIAVNATGTVTVFACDVDPVGNTATVTASRTVTVAAGLNSVSLNINILAGQHVGAFTTAGIRFQNSVNVEGIYFWFKTTLPSTNTPVDFSTQHRFELEFEVESGLFATVSQLDAGSGGATEAGIGVLDAADATGILDSTAAFTSAKSAHPTPYVRPGTFALTSVPAAGGGLYGPGNVEVSGSPLLLQAAPRLTSLQRAFQASMQEHITNGDVLTLIADSIGHWAFASSASKHWFNRLTRFANLGIAADEPEMTAFADVNVYTPAFYGLTFSGSTSIGSRGPLSQSLILASGASISFVGIHEQVDVHYVRDTSNGTLEWSYNGGSPFKSLNTSGSLALDLYSGPTATGQTASGTYTLTASGGPVEITGLIRLGTSTAATATSPRRLRTLRAARGSYSFASFGAAPVTSILTQASYAGGKCVPIIALGINDSFGTNPASIVTNATALLNNLEAGGVDRIFALPPMRPTSAWNGVYTGGRTYDGAAGAIRSLYRERGVQIIPADGLDWAGEGFFQDGLHPNDGGNERIARIVAEEMSK